MQNDMDHGGWDEHYRTHDYHGQAGKPNQVLLAEIVGRNPGRALDVGCGLGDDAIWLASQGWQVTAVDIAQTALNSASVAADNANVTVTWVCADISINPPTSGAYDLVSVQYPALRRDSGDRVIHSLLDAVAPGGTILVVGHGSESHDYARSQGFEPTEYVEPADFVVQLDDNWAIEVLEVRPRINTPGSSSQFTHDSVLRARRHR
jgi:SAM-dependent methyltransferase